MPLLDIKWLVNSYWRNLITVSADKLASTCRVSLGQLAGGWRENLSGAEQEAMHEALGDALEEFGYTADPPLAAAG